MFSYLTMAIKPHYTIETIYSKDINNNFVNTLTYNNKSENKMILSIYNKDDVQSFVNEFTKNIIKITDNNDNDITSEFICNKKSSNDQSCDNEFVCCKKSTLIHGEESYKESGEESDKESCEESIVIIYNSHGILHYINNYKNIDMYNYLMELAKKEVNLYDNFNYKYIINKYLDNITIYRQRRLGILPYDEFINTYSYVIVNKKYNDMY